MGFEFMDSHGLVAYSEFVLDGHSFGIVKLFPTCTYFLFNTIYSFHDFEWELRGVRKIHKWVCILKIHMD